MRSAADAEVLAAEGVAEAARQLVIPCAVLAMSLFLLALVLPRAWRRTMFSLAGIILALGLVAYVFYLPNSA